MVQGNYVESKILGERHLVADNLSLLDAECPIDGAKLVSGTDYDGSYSLCLICRTHYHSIHDSDALKKTAIEELERRQKDAEEKRRELSRLEQLLMAAEQTGLIK